MKRNLYHKIRCGRRKGPRVVVDFRSWDKKTLGNYYEKITFKNIKYFRTKEGNRHLFHRRFFLNSQKSPTKTIRLSWGGGGWGGQRGYNYARRGGTNRKRTVSVEKGDGRSRKILHKAETSPMFVRTSTKERGPKNRVLSRGLGQIVARQKRQGLPVKRCYLVLPTLTARKRFVRLNKEGWLWGAKGKKNTQAAQSPGKEKELRALLLSGPRKGRNRFSLRLGSMHCTATQKGNPAVLAGVPLG